MTTSSLMSGLDYIVLIARMSVADGEDFQDFEELADVQIFEIHVDRC